MKKDFYLIESSRWSDNGSINPVVHAIVYATADTVAIKMLDFLKEHMAYMADNHGESLDASNLAESAVDARLVSVFRTLADMTTDDVSFDCPEWGTSYRIRELAVSENKWRSLRVLTNHKVILGVVFSRSKDGDEYDFETNNPTVRPEYKLAEEGTSRNPQYDEMCLTLNEFSTEGLEW